VATDGEDFWPGFINGLLGFFETGESIIAKETTLEIVSLMDAGCHALTTPGEWVNVAV